MPLSPTPEDAVEITASLKRYFLEEFDQPLSDLKARLLLDYVLKEIGPVAYNAGVRDAEAFLRRTVEDLPATCFEAPLTYWRQKRK